ncbi:MAG: hypothetical protein COB12_03825 [Flavobacterium sp.]|nr:MAG: hypothetical protein COB12_03825 [Flavobacterium sp.]
MKNLISKTLVLLFVSFFIFSCKSDKKQETDTIEETKVEETIITKELPNTFSLKELSLHPEGIIYSDATKKTYVGSYFKGKIITVDLDGNMTDFVTDESLVAVVGMTIDKTKNRLLVCNSNSGLSLKSKKETIGRLAEVIAYDLTTGEKLKTFDLASLYQGGHFLNDITTDDKGNAFVTDSFSPVIYKIDANDNTSVLVNNKQFEVPQGAFGLNGIVYHTDGYLITGMFGKLYKIALDNPENVQEITLDKSINSLDGLLLLDTNTIALASNYFMGPKFDEAIYKIETTDNWTTAKVTSTFKNLAGVFPTTLTKIENDVYVSYGYFGDLVNPESAPNDSFKLQKIIF